MTIIEMDCCRHVADGMMRSISVRHGIELDYRHLPGGGRTVVDVPDDTDLDDVLDMLMDAMPLVRMPRRICDRPTCCNRAVGEYRGEHLCRECADYAHWEGGRHA